mgnify:CR=1 FL=1
MEVERISSFFSVLIILVFGMAVVFGLVNWQTNPFDPIFATPEAPMSCLVDSLSIGIWMYCGYECIAAMSGEYEDSSRNVAKGFRIALPLIALSYVLPTCLPCGLPGRSWTNGASTAAFVRRTGLRHDLLDGARALRRRAVPRYRHYEPVHNLQHVSGKRVAQLLGALGGQSVPSLHPQSRSRGSQPYIGVLTIAISSLIFSQFDFTTIIEMNIIFILARYMFLGFIVLKLRRMYPVQDRPADMFVIGGGKVGVRLYSALAFSIATFALCLNPVGSFFATVAFLASGVVAYIIFKKIYGALPWRTRWPTRRIRARASLWAIRAASGCSPSSLPACLC